jgi:hypothetical protein
VESLPFRDGQFDVVLSTLMLHHLPGKLRGRGSEGVEAGRPAVSYRLRHIAGTKGYRRALSPPRSHQPHRNGRYLQGGGIKNYRERRGGNRRP